MPRTMTTNNATPQPIRIAGQGDLAFAIGVLPAGATGGPPIGRQVAPSQ